MTPSESDRATIAVVYHSEGGSTACLADAIVEGIDQIEGAQALPLRVVGEDIVAGKFRNLDLLKQIDNAAGVLFGSPTYMGSASAEFKAFADASSDWWPDQVWAGKVASGFTTGFNLSGDQLHTIQYFAILAAQHGMLWSGIDVASGYDPLNRNALGAQSGLIVQSADGRFSDIDLKTADYLGRRVATLSCQLLAGSETK